MNGGRQTDGDGDDAEDADGEINANLG